MKNQIVITADDFGISKETNLAIMDSFKNGVLTSTCVMANGEAFLHAMDEVYPQIKDISLGVHLNIIEGKSQLSTSKQMLTDNQDIYNNGFIALLVKSFNNKFLDEIEKDFRVQIETILEKSEVEFINSHVHTHSIPRIFELTCKLADEYKIPFIRTQAETPYYAPKFNRHLNINYPINLIKMILLNFFSIINFRTIKKYNVKTNKRFLGVTYTGNMDKNAIVSGIERIKNSDELLEIILHPTVDELKINNNIEYKTLIDPSIKEYLGQNLTDFKKLI